MESANSHPHQHLQDQILASPNSWPPPPILNPAGSSYITESRESVNSCPVMTSSSNYSCMEMGGVFQSWGGNKYNEILQPVEEDSIGPKMQFVHNYGSQGELYNNNQNGGILPLTQMGTLDMNLEAIDLLASSRFGGNFSSHPSNSIGILRDGFFSNYGLDHHTMQQLGHFPLFASHKESASTNASVESKRNNIKLEPKAPFATAPKKSRLEVRASCPPFKVRKEKLGDRIAALQQLVAPFGKTDTASVLKEAIGYIKFLHNQVETLSVPYMKASRNKSIRLIKGGGDTTESSGEEATRRDLKNRGLCLVPLSCLSYITEGGGAVVWPPLPPHFGGGAT